MNYICNRSFLFKQQFSTSRQRAGDVVAAILYHHMPSTPHGAEASTRHQDAVHPDTWQLHQRCSDTRVAGRNGCQVHEEARKHFETLENISIAKIGGIRLE